MARGPKPMPAALQEARGNPGKRRIPNENLAVKTLPEPPEHLTPEARAEWDRVAERLYAWGNLAEIDRATLFAYCQCWGRLIEAEEVFAKMKEHDPVTGALVIKTSNGNLIQNPVIGIINKLTERMVQLAAEFGMTPSSRTRIFTQLLKGERDKPDPNPDSKPSAEVEELLEYLGGDSESGDFGTTH